MYRVALGEAVEHDAQQEPSTYTFHDGGYVDARGVNSEYVGAQADGSTMWR
jgi:hypothetical protein